MGLLEEVKRRRSVIESYYRNYYRHLEAKEYAKASEDLWGIVNNLLSILRLLMEGKPVSGHRDARAFLSYLANLKGDVRLIDLMDACEVLHANYFHNFMDGELFNRYRLRAEWLIKRLDRYVEEEIRKRGVDLKR